MPKTTDVMQWAIAAPVGAVAIYTTSHPGYPPNRRAMASALAAHEAGLVFLAQKTVLDGKQYCAIRISERAAKALGHSPQ